jgi:hypothetical protein
VADRFAVDLLTQAATGPLWFQHYASRDREVCVLRVEAKTMVNVAHGSGADDEQVHSLGRPSRGHATCHRFVDPCVPASVEPVWAMPERLRLTGPTLPPE